MFSCGAFKITPSAEPTSKKEVITKEKEKDTKVISPKVDTKDEKETKTEKLATSSVRFKGEIYQAYVHSGNFEIAVMLPFHLNNQTGSNSSRSNLMLDYYHGMKLAIEELEKQTSTFKFHIFDTENDTNKVKTLLSNPILEQVDLIIGPTSEDQVRLAAYFARKHQIPLVSPVTTVDKLWSDNPYFIQLASTAYAQAFALLNHIKISHFNQKIFVVRDGSRNDLSFGEVLVELLSNKFNIPYEVITHSNNINWENLVNSNDNIVVIQTTENTMRATTTVNSLVSRKGVVSLYVSDKWFNFENIKYSNWGKLDLYFYSQRNDLSTKSKSGQVKRFYRLNYGTTPSEFVLMGYDQTLFLGELLNAFGKYFPLFVQDKLFKYDSHNFRLIEGNHCLQNVGISLLKFTESELIPETLRYR
jgi:ABC-type branched-subunit amino acid transport system substrate-binding protein